MGRHRMEGTGREDQPTGKRVDTDRQPGARTSYGQRVEAQPDSAHEGQDRGAGDNNPNER